MDDYIGEEIEEKSIGDKLLNRSMKLFEGMTEARRLFATCLMLLFYAFLFATLFLGWMVLRGG